MGAVRERGKTRVGKKEGEGREARGRGASGVRGRSERDWDYETRVSCFACLLRYSSLLLYFLFILVRFLI